MQKKEKIDLSKIKSIYFVGIGGIGISALAKMVISYGIKVSGVNDEESSKTLEPLRLLGVNISFSSDLKEIPEADLYVYSDAWLHRGPEIIENAKKTGKPVLSYFETLGVFAKNYKVIAISGTHGKTTTTAMIAEILIKAGLDPTVIVGSFVKSLNNNFRKGESEYLVIEADEYNKHFLNFNPWITVITNIEADHLDCYKDLEDIKNTFERFILQTKNAIIYNSEDVNTNTIIKKFQGKVIDYTRFLKEVQKLSVPGMHNRMNAAASLAVAETLNVDNHDAVKFIKQFSGTWRRLEYKGETSEGIIIYDDYAHHPTEIKASLEALRELYPEEGKKIVVLFQPHLYSRTKALFEDFTKSFQQADIVIFLPIYFAREFPDPSISSKKLAEVMNKNGGNVKVFSDFEKIKDFIYSLNLNKGDVLVTMGAGEAHKLIDLIL